MGSWVIRYIRSNITAFDRLDNVEAVLFVVLTATKKEASTVNVSIIRSNVQKANLFRHESLTRQNFSSTSPLKAFLRRIFAIYSRDFEN